MSTSFSANQASVVADNSDHLIITLNIFILFLNDLPNSKILLATEVSYRNALWNIVVA